MLTWNTEQCIHLQFRFLTVGRRVWETKPTTIKIKVARKTRWGLNKWYVIVDSSIVPVEFHEDEKTVMFQLTE